MRGWLWLHFTADAGLHAQALRVGTLADLIGATGHLREALLTTRELLPLLRARGVELRRHRRSLLLYRAPTCLIAPILSWLTQHITAARISLEAHDDPSATEPRAIYQDALESARTHHIATPRLEATETHFV